MEVIKILGQTNPISGEEILYVVPEGKACVVSYLNISNRDTADHTISIRIGSAENLDLIESGMTWIEYDMLVYTKCSAQRLKGTTLAAGDMIMVSASSEHLAFSLFGSEFTQDFSYTEEGGGDYGYGY